MAAGLAQALNGRTAVVLGASGQVGIFALPMLAARGWRVLAVSRRAKTPSYPDIEGVEWLATRQATDVGATALLSAGPLELAVRWLAANPRIDRVAATSTSSVLTKAASADEAERLQIASIVEAEHALEAACASRAASLCLLRPTLVYGCGLDRNISRLAAFIRRFGFLPLAWDAEGLRQPLHAEDLAAALVCGLVDRATLTSPLCGGSVLSYREMAERVFEALGRRPRLMALPTSLLAAAVRLAGGAQASAEMVRRQSRDLLFDDDIARAVLNVEPRPFRPGAADFEYPAAKRLRALAHPAG